MINKKIIEVILGKELFYTINNESYSFFLRQLRRVPDHYAFGIKIYLFFLNFLLLIFLNQKYFLEKIFPFLPFSNEIKKFVKSIIILKYYDRN